jgi:hypothetical protein
MSSLANDTSKTKGKRSFNTTTPINKKIKTDYKCQKCNNNITYRKKSILPCGHVYCTGCIFEVIKQKSKKNKKLNGCPICKSKFSKINIKETYTNQCELLYRNANSKSEEEEEEDNDNDGDIDCNSNSDSDNDNNNNDNNNNDNDKKLNRKLNNKIDITKIKVKSFTNPNEIYICNIVENKCTCPHFINRHAICKHLKKCHADY